MRRREFVRSMMALPLAGLLPPSTGKLSQCSPPMIGIDLAAPCGDRSAVWAYGPNGKWELIGWTRPVEMKLATSRVTEYRVGDVIAFGEPNS